MNHTISGTIRATLFTSLAKIQNSLTVEYLLVVTFLCLLASTVIKPRNLPPGPFRWPIIGSLPFGSLRSYADYYHKKYGDIFCAKMGTRLVVFLSDFQTIKAVFSSPDVAGRPDYHTLQRLHYFQNNGLLFSQGRQWNAGRKFALRHLKNFGLGKSKMESAILEEASDLIRSLRKSLDIPVQINWNVNVAVVNVIWNIVTGHRYSVGDEELNRLVKHIGDLTLLMTGPATMFNYFPWLEFMLPSPFKNKWLKLRDYDYYRDELTQFYQKIINEHVATLDINSPRDYIDMYLIEVENTKADSETSFHSDLKDLTAQVHDYFGAGSETTSSTLRWLFLYMAKFPEIQAKIQQEIDEVVPKGSLPTLDYKERLPYLQAVIHELNRKISLGPFVLPHTATVDIQISGYNIPRGTIVLANAEACHNNKRLWEHPDKFYPEHFLDSDGKFIQKKDGYLPFSVGRRTCLAEAMAKMVLFLFAAAIFQTFTVAAPSGERLSTEPLPDNQLLNLPQPYKIIIAERK